MPELLPEYAHYRVLERPGGGPWLLGSGGMGQTYKALDTRLKIPVALKVIHPGRLTDPALERLFIREARAAARVTHPNVAPVVFLGDQPGNVFYAMEFVDGVSLHALLHRHGPRPIAQALAFAAQIASGLSGIHERGVIHRDLKPANVMVVEYPPEHPLHAAYAASGGCQLKIIDFGLAKVSAPDFAETVGGPQTAGFRGTALYASPEQCSERRDLDARSDLYSLGCILWELLAGAPPFAASSQIDLLIKHISQPPPIDRLPQLPGEIRALLQRALAKKREERFPDALAFAQALEKVRAALPAETAQRCLPLTVAAGGDAPGSSLEDLLSSRTVDPPAPRPSPVVWVASAALLVALGLGVGWWFRAAPPAANEQPRLGAPTAPAPSAEHRLLALLPFLEPDAPAAERYFADGLHEDVLATLSRLRALQVFPSTAVQAFRDPAQRDLGQIRRQVGAGAVLEITLRREALRVRADAKLTETSSRQVLWQRSFDHLQSDILQLHGEIARGVATVLQLQPPAEEMRAVLRRPTKSHQAYDLYLQGRAVERDRGLGQPNFLKATLLYERAVALDAEFALAWAHLSIASASAHWQDQDRSPERLERARLAQETSLRLQPDSTEAQVAAGTYLYNARYDWAGALAAFTRACEMDPRHADALSYCGNALRRLGRWEESVGMFERALAIESENTRTRTALSFSLSQLRRWAEMEAVCALDGRPRRGFELLHATARMQRTRDWGVFIEAVKAQPDNAALEWRFADELTAGLPELILARTEKAQGEGLDDPDLRAPISLWRATALHYLGRKEEARTYFERAIGVIEKTAAMRPNNHQLRMRHAWALAGAGRPAEALTAAREAMAMRSLASDAVTGASLQALGAHVFVLAGNLDGASELLEELLRVPSDLTILHLYNDPRWQPLRQHPRIVKLLGANG